MNTQLQFNFSGFNPDTFQKVKEAHRQAEIKSLQDQIDHMKHVIAGFKGYRTKRKRNHKNQ